MADIVESLHLNVPDVPDVHLHMLGTPVQSYKWIQQPCSLSDLFLCLFMQTQFQTVAEEVLMSLNSDKLEIQHCRNTLLMALSTLYVCSGQMYVILFEFCNFGLNGAV